MVYGRKMFVWSALLAGLMLKSICASADENPSLQLRATSGLKAGNVRDGTLLMSGRVSSDSSHVGFRLLCRAEPKSVDPGRCTLSGQRDPGHRLRVRLSGPAWRPGAQSDGAVITYATGAADFRLEADGDQYVDTDTWTVALSGSVLN